MNSGIEKGISAAAKQRPVFDALMQRLKPGDSFIVWDLDWAFRSVIDALLTAKALVQCGIHFRIITMSIDTATPAGMLMLRDKVLENITKAEVVQAFEEYTIARMPFRNPFELGPDLSLQLVQPDRVKVKMKHHCFCVYENGMDGVVIIGYGRRFDISSVNEAFVKLFFEMTDVFLSDILILADNNQCSRSNAIRFIEEMARIGHLRIDYVV